MSSAHLPDPSVHAPVPATRVRAAEPADAPAVRDIYAPFVDGSATSFEAEAPDAAAIEQRIRDVQRTHPFLVFEAAGRVVGYAYAAPHRTRQAYQWCVEVSVYVAAAARGRGVGRALYTCLFEVLRRQGYVNAYAGITLPNAASVGLHEAMGFAWIGTYPRIGFKLGRWHDVAWLQLRLQDAAVPVAQPAPPQPILADPAVRAFFRGNIRANPGLPKCHDHGE